MERYGVIDYLTITVKNTRQEAIGILGATEDDLKSLEGGIFGYKRKAILYGDILVADQGTPEMGTMLQVSGEGCRELTARQIDHIHLLQRLLKTNANITRLDIAIDDYTGLVTPDKLYDAARKGLLCSKWRNWHLHTGGTCADGEIGGKTFSLGNRESLIYLRVYDKALEQKEKAGNDPAKLALIPDVWNRIELELKDERAAEAAQLLADQGNIGQVASGILRQYLSVKVQGSSQQKTRWREAEWWAEFLEEILPIRLTQPPPTKTIEQVKEWIMRQCAPSLALLFRHGYGEIKLLLEIIENGDERLTAKHWRLLNKSLAD